MLAGAPSPPPVLELLLAHLGVEFGDALLETRLGVRHPPVVDGRPDLLEEEVQETAGGLVADGLPMFSSKYFRMDATASSRASLVSSIAMSR